VPFHTFLLTSFWLMKKSRCPCECARPSELGFDKHHQRCGHPHCHPVLDGCAHQPVGCHCCLVHSELCRLDILMGLLTCQFCACFHQLPLSSDPGLYPIQFIVNKFVQTPVTSLVSLTNAHGVTLDGWFALSGDVQLQAQ
jgi:hypothetical protein